MLTWFMVIVGFSVVVILHEAGHLIVAKKNGIKVETFSLGMGKRLFGKKIGDTDYRVSLVPLGGYCKMAGEDPNEAKGSDEEFSSKPPGRRFWVIAAGSIANYILAFFIFSLLFMTGMPTLSNEIGGVIESSPAYEAGLMPSDRIVAINGEETLLWEDITDSVRAFDTGEGPLVLTVLRGGEELKIEILPEKRKQVDELMREVERPAIGISPSEERAKVSYGFFEAINKGGAHLLKITGLTYRALGLMIVGALPLAESVTGPVGILHVTSEAARMGFSEFFLMMAVISMALAIFNLLPIPVLDGGFLLFIGIEKLRGRPVSPRVQEKATMIALYALLAFFLYVTWQDLLRFTFLGG